MLQSSLVTAYLRSLTTDDRTPPGGWPFGAPPSELLCSPASRAVGRLAAADGFFLFNYEHAAARELPDDWVPLDRAELADPPGWQGGVLAERKYQSFRHDQPIGAMHAGQRAKWTAHELLHSIVGFAWAPGATPFFHATAGRLAELLPVAHWYFFDEAFRRRCPLHRDEGALFRTFCPDCERILDVAPDDARAEERVRDGLRYVDRELAAVARSRREGRPVPHTYATLDLASDGVAYAAAHGARLSSDTFRRYAELTRGGFPTLEALEARTEAVLAALLTGEPLEPFAPSRAAGNARWRLMDVAWRMATIAHDTSGDAETSLWSLIEALCAPIHTNATDIDGTLRTAIARYRELADEYVLPETEDAFALGHPLVDGLGSSIGQLSAGVDSALPLTAGLLGDQLSEHVYRFSRADHADRRPLGERFAAHLTADPALPTHISDLARYEAAVIGAPPGDETAAALGTVGATPHYRLARGLRILRFECDVAAFAEQVEHADESAPADQHTALVIGRVGGLDDVTILEVSPKAALALDDLGDGGDVDLPDADVRGFVDLGVLVPASWPI